MDGLKSLRQKVAEAVARRDSATPGLWEVIDGHYPGFRVLVGPSFEVAVVMQATGMALEDGFKRECDLQFIAAHHADIETMQELMAKVEALEVMRVESEHKLNELVMCVAQKHPGESRFDTAKRLILRAEESYDGKGKQNDTR